MQSVSNEYKVSMAKPFRNRAHIRATIGITDLDAQRSAKTYLDHWNYAMDYDDAPLGKTVKTFYATCESDFAKVDGSMAFANPDTQFRVDDYYYQGAVTDAPNKTIYFVFDDDRTHTINGLTIDFTDYHPSEIEVAWDGGTRTYDVDSNIFVTNDVFENCTEISVRQTDSGSDYHLFRIASITFGRAKVFTDEDIISYSQDEYVSPISESLPTLDMTLIVQNYDGSFDPDNENSLIYSLMEKQPMTIQFGYEIDDDGENIEWIEPTVGYMADWSATETQAVLNAKDLLYFINDTVSVLPVTSYEGQRVSGIAENILYDLDVPYEVSIWSINHTKNGMEDCEIPSVLQQVANATGATFRFSRDGSIVLTTNKNETVLQTNSDSGNDYSNPVDFLAEATQSYALQSYNSSSVDGDVIFAPRTPIVQASGIGFCGSSVADESGNYSETQYITLQQEGADPINCNDLDITFNGISPSSITITETYSDGTTSSETVGATTSDQTFHYRHRFVDVSEFTIYFNEGRTGSAIQINRLTVGGTDDFEITREMILDTPVASMREKIKTINVKKTVADFDETLATIKTVTKSFTTNRYLTISWNDEYLVNGVTSNNSNIKVGKIMDFTTKSITFLVDVRSSGSATFTVKGYRLNSNVSSVDSSIDVDSFGETIDWDNPLNDGGCTSTILESLRNWYLGSVDYRFSWRGDPRVDVGDVVKYELRDGTKVPVKIYRNSLSYSGAWSGSISARRVEDQ